MKWSSIKTVVPRIMFILFVALLVLGTCGLGFWPEAKAQAPDLVHYGWFESTLTLTTKVPLENLNNGLIHHTNQEGTTLIFRNLWEEQADGSLRWEQYVPVWSIQQIWIEGNGDFSWIESPSDFPMEWEVVWGGTLNRWVLQLENPIGTIACNGDCSQVWFRTNRNPLSTELLVRFRDDSPILIPWMCPWDDKWYTILDSSIIAGRDFSPIFSQETSVYLMGGVTPTEDDWYRVTCTPPLIEEVIISPPIAHPGQTVRVQVTTNFEDFAYEVGIEWFNGWETKPLDKEVEFTFTACWHCAPQQQMIYVRIFKAGDYSFVIDDTVVSYENVPWPHTSFIPLVFR